MREMAKWQRLNPVAAAVAAGGTALVLTLLLALPMLGMGGMMGSYGGMMRGYGYGFAFAWWFGGALIAALAGAIFAWIYNAVNQ